ncbi:TPA: hypothetical protein LA742_002417 [Clostridium botulinum]|nr:hypothetical protein RSJ11_03755 [Clostridium sporogenes]AVQ51741.1 hypothetical protein C7M59_02270 [Clostridium botulinum]HBJ2613934.1 hypothetical protein [Clostridium botulinum]
MKRIVQHIKDEMLCIKVAEPLAFKILKNLIMVNQVKKNFLYQKNMLSLKLKLNCYKLKKLQI